MLEKREERGKTERGCGEIDKIKEKGKKLIKTKKRCTHKERGTKRWIDR